MDLKWRAGINWSLVAAFTAIAVSLWSLKQSLDINRALNKPTIIGVQQDTPELYRYSISNPGTAPAYLSYVNYYVDSNPVDVEDFRKAIVDYMSGFGVANQLTTTFPGSHTVLAAGDSIDIVRIQFLPAEYSKREQMDPSRFQIKIGYKSALGETGEFDSAE